MGLFELVFPILFILTHSAIDHLSLDGSVLNSITFDEKTSEKFGGSREYEIGWKRVFFCNEVYPSAANVPVFRYTGKDGELDSSEFVALAPYAITAKIVPEGEGLTPQEFDNYAIYAKVCQNPIIALNNLLEMSYVVNVDTLQIASTHRVINWFGTSTALGRLGGVNTRRIDPITNMIFHSAGSANMFNVLNDGGYCSWDARHIHDGRSIAMYFGFDINRKNVCDGKGKGELITLPCNNNDDCNDDNLCTMDVCFGSNGCVNQVIKSCDDNNECTIDKCNPNDGTCSHKPTLIAQECGDETLCNGEEICNKLTGQCENGENVVCKFGEKCVANKGYCVPDCTVFDIDEYTEECSSSIVFNSYSESHSDSIGAIFGIKVKDSSIINLMFGIIALLIINLMLMIMFHIYWYRQIKNQKCQTYQKVEIENKI